MCRPDAISTAETSRQRWAGLAVLLAVAISTGFGPSAMAWALVPGPERSLLMLGGEAGADRTGTRQIGARQIHDAIARVVRDLLKGKSLDLATARPLGWRVSPRGLRERAWALVPASQARVRSELPRIGRLPQPPPIG